MKKNTVNLRSLVDKHQENCKRINEIADACEKEQRERTEAESEEYNALVRENQLLGMRMQAATADYARENRNVREEAEQMIRENLAAGRRTEIIMVQERDFTGMMVSDASNGGLIPLNIQDVIKPLQEGFILDKVGLPMPTGLAGSFVWPIYDLAEANVAGEGVALTDSKIDLNKLTATPERIGIAIPVTHQAINQSEGVIETLVRRVMPQALAQLLNKIVFGLEKVSGASYLIGPYAHIVQKATAVAPTDEDKRYADLLSVHETPTFDELNRSMKAAVLETGIDGNHLCWVMTKSMQATLEGQPINASGIHIPMVQDGKLCGLPIYTSNVMRTVVKTYKQASVAGSTTTWADYTPGSSEFTVAFKIVATPNTNVSTALAGLSGVKNNDICEIDTVTEYIGIGDWAYQPMGLFGNVRFTVDPFSQARKDAVDFVLNADYATKTLRPEAFKLAKAVTANS